MISAQITQYAITALADYDDSHGYAHASRVYNYAKLLVEPYRDELMKGLNTVINSYLDCIVQAIALLHDVSDYKYDKNGQKRIALEKWLAKIFPERDSNIILWVIDHLSWSKENKYGVPQHPDNLAVDLLRAILADADRLDAMGKHGILRCEQYVRTLPESKEKSDKDIRQQVLAHAKEKLLLLYPNKFIVTKRGRNYAMLLHDEMVHYLNNYK